MTELVTILTNSVNRGNSKMKIKNRQDKLVEIIRRRGKASVEELADLLDASRETIRRDLTQLSGAGKILKVHGGATLPRAFGEGPFLQRLSENVEAKMKIAQAAGKLFNAGETLFIDTGSTVLFFAEELAKVAGLTVVTNSTEIARTIAKVSNGTRVFLLGGEFTTDNSQTVGTMVADQIRLFRAHHAVLTIGAMDERSGVMDFNIEEAQVARAMIAQSESLTVLVDQSKFNTLASFEVCQLASIDRLVCDVAPPREIAKMLVTSGCEIIVAD
jgi:DeoR/GlpR family transcriptional regulator of sugar metabolism